MLNTYYAYRFVRLLTQDWRQTDAYKFGLIDGDGELVRSPKSKREKKAYSLFHRLVWNLRRLLQKVPLGRSTISRYASALYLLKEHCETNLAGFNDFHLLEKCFVNEMLDEDTRKIVTTLCESKQPKLEKGSYDIIIRENESIVTININEDLEPVDTVLGLSIFEHNGLVFTVDDCVKIINEDVSTGNMDGGTSAGSSEVSYGSFANARVYTVDSDRFYKSMQGKNKYHKYDKYVGSDEVGESIRQYGRANPSKPIILKDSTTGSMIYLKRT